MSHGVSPPSPFGRTLFAVLASVLFPLASASAQAGFTYTYDGRTFTDPKAALAAHQAVLDAELDRVPAVPSPRAGKLIILVPHPQEIRWLIPGNAHMARARLDFLIAWRQQYFQTLGQALVKAHVVADAIVGEYHIGGEMNYSPFDYVIRGEVSPHIGHARAYSVWSVASGGARAYGARADRAEPEQDPAAFVDAVRGTLLLLPASVGTEPSWNGEAFDTAAIQSYAEAQHRQCRDPLPGMPSGVADVYRARCDCQWDRFAAHPRASQALTDLDRPQDRFGAVFSAVLTDSRRACGLPDEHR